MMNTEKALIPSRRFPNYHDEKGWKQYKLSDITSVITDKCGVANLCIETYISTENILPNYGGIKIASKLPKTGTFTCFKKGDVLFSNIRPYLKKVWLASFDGVASNDIIVFRALAGFDASFVSCIIKSDAFIAYSMIGAKGVKMPRGDKDMMLHYDVYVPNIEEQKEIAACLLFIDSYISSIYEKVEQLKAHKKSLMQKMFPQKGQTAPVFRFPEFNTEWKKVTLGDIFVERREHSTITDDLPQLSFTIEEGVIYPNNKKTNKRDFLINDKDNKKYLVTYIDDIIYNPANVIYGAIHKNSLCNGVVSPIYKIFSTSQDASFMEYIVRMPEFIQKMSTYMEGTVLKLRTLKPESFLKMEVFIAPSLAEQRKIAECLSSIDKTIEYYTKKSVILEQHKKGLMQQLFPKLKEL